MMIQENKVHSGAEQVNDVYVISNANMDEFNKKSYNTGTWMSNILCPDREVSRAATKIGISINNLK